jgi:hypothetical protein
MLEFVGAAEEECRRPSDRPFRLETHRLPRSSALSALNPAVNPTLIARQVMRGHSEKSGCIHHSIVGADIGLRKWHD